MSGACPSWCSIKFVAANTVDNSGNVMRFLEEQIGLPEVTPDGR